MVTAAVLGVGAIGQHHARIYSELPDTVLTAVADCDEAIANKFGQKYNVPAYTDVDELLSRNKPQVVSVAVPTVLHESVASKALQAGCHVLVEKPIAASVEEGQRLIETAQKYDRLLMIGHIVRFNPAIQVLKSRLEAGELGRVYQIICRRIGPFPDLERVRDVGVVIDLAPHDVDVMRYLLNEEPVRVYAETENRIHTKHEDMLLGFLQFSTGVKGLLETNWLTPTKIREVAVLGERGMFLVNDLTQDLYFFENSIADGELWDSLSTLRGVSEGTMYRFPINRQEPLRLEIEAFIDALQSGKSAPVTGEDGLAALRISQALVLSGVKQEVIYI